MTTRVSNSYFLNIQPPLPVDAAGWEVRVISSHDWATVLGYVKNWRNITGSMELNGYGAGMIELNVNHPILSTPFPNNIQGDIRSGEYLWQFWRDGVLRHEWISDDEQEEEVSDDYNGVIKISGRTLEKVLDWAIHKPVWGERQAYDITGSPTGGTYKLTANGENTVAIAWNATPDQVRVAIEGFSFVNPGDVSVRFSTENPWRYIIQFMGGLIGVDVPRLQAAEVALTGGTDPDLDIPEMDDNNSWTDLDGTIKGQPAIASVLAFLDRASERGVFPFLDVSFNLEQDSAGNAWTDLTDVTIQPGETFLQLLQRLSDMLGWEFRVYSGFKLWVEQSGYGIHRESEVVFYKSAHQMKQERNSSSREVVTDVYAQSANYEVSHTGTTSTVTPWKREAWIEAGGSPTTSSAAAVAFATLEVRKNKKVSRTIAVPPELKTRAIFQDYEIADWVTIETQAGMEAVKVVGYSFNSDPSLEFGLEIVIQSTFEAREVRVQKALEAMGSKAATGGQGSSPTGPAPVQRAIGVRDLTDVNLGGLDSGDVLVRSGTTWVPVAPTLDFLTDVNTTTTPPTDGQALVYQSSSGLWKPGTVSGGGGGGGSAPTVRATNSAYAGTGPTVAITIPATAVVGDMLIVVIGADWGVNGKTGYAGWWNVGSADGSNTNICTFAKICEAGDIGAVKNFTLAGSTAWTAYAMAINGGKLVRPSPAFAHRQGSSGSSQKFSTPLSHIGANDLVLLWGGCRTGSKTVTWDVGTMVHNRTADSLWSSALWKTDGKMLLDPTVTTVGGASLGGLCQAGLTISA